MGSKKTFPVYYYEASDLHVATILALDPLIFLLLGGRMLPDLYFFLSHPLISYLEFFSCILKDICRQCWIRCTDKNILESESLTIR